MTEIPLFLDWLERAKKLPEKEVGREAGTLNRHLTQLQEILTPTNEGTT